MDSSGVSTTTQQVPTNDASAPVGNSLSAFLPVILVCVLFYFLMLRPQQKREAQKREKLSKLTRGDCVVTNGGIIGKVDKVVSDTEITLEVSDGVSVRVYKNFIAEVLDKSKALTTDDNKESKKEKRVAKRTKKEDKQQVTGSSTEK